MAFWPPQLLTTLPSWSKASTGGVPSEPFWLRGRCAIQTLSCESTATPTTLPNIQSSGNAFGQRGSTRNTGSPDDSVRPVASGIATSSVASGVGAPPQADATSANTISPA